MLTGGSGNINTTNKKFPPDHTKQIIFLIRKLVQASELYTKELNKKYQVSSAQLNCILTLYEYGPLPLSKIANHIMVKSPTVTGVVDRLEKKGLAERMRNSADRRVITIQLTEAGKKLAKNAPPPIQQKILDGLKQTEKNTKEQIVNSLNILSAMLDVHDLEV
jgi:DNA-binding MarR family transcriptional regulator